MESQPKNTIGEKGADVDLSLSLQKSDESVLHGFHKFTIFLLFRDTLLAKAEFLTKIGEKDAAVEAIRKTMEKTVGLGNRMDLLFHNIRIGLFWMDHSLIKANIEKATIMMEEGGMKEFIMVYVFLRNWSNDSIQKQNKNNFVHDFRKIL